MELPDDVLEIVRAYAKPSEPYKMYKSIQKILLHDISMDMRDYLRRKLKKALRLHFERFLPLFLELEKSDVELTASQNAFSYTPSEVRMEYYFILRHLASKKRELITQLKALG
jgi:hypothetical protein